MRKIYLAIGSALVAIGIAGFIMPRPLFGLFEVNTLHNIVHIASGALTLIAASQGIGAMRAWGRLFGPIYLALAIVGSVQPNLFGLMHVNLPDNLLHFAVAAGFLYVGLLAPPKL
jgi:hypothetical protein